MSPIKPRTMSGVMELLPRDQVAFQRMLDTIRRSYERFGFLPVETPVMEYTDVLLTKSGGDTEKQVYFVQSTGDREQGREPELALRFDLTVPLARYVAEHEQELVFPFRRYQMQRVYRGESAQRGRYREFYQCDIDVIDRERLSLQFDAEIPVVIHQTFSDLAFGDFTIAINNRKVLNGFLAGLGIVRPEQRALALREVDKLDKVEAAGIRRALTGERVGLAPDVADRLLALTATRGSNAEILAQIAEQGVDHPDFAEGFQELEQVTRMIADLQVPDQRIRINPAISRGLDYYTGTVYETFLTAHPELGSICSGGRYDNLAGHYTSSRLPGVGISIGATRLFYQLLQLGLVDNQRSSVAVLVTQMDARFASDYRRIASDLRAHGLATELYPEADKLGKQLKHASRSGIPFAVIVGDSEQQRACAVLKKLATGVQSEVPWDRLAQAIQDALAER